MHDKRYLIHGLLPAIGSACSFALMASLIKIAAQDLPAPMLVFMRSFLGLFIILPFVLSRGYDFIQTTRLKMHLFRSVISLCAMTCFFYAIGHIGLAETTLLNATSPLFIGILAVLILGESVTLPVIIALITGFIGISLILKPGTELFTSGALVALLSGFFIGCAKILVRYMANTEPVMRTVFYFSIFSTIYSAVPLIWFWETPSTWNLLIMALASICATCGQTLLTYAFTHNEAVTVAPFTYVTVLAATLIGWLGWQELPDIGSSIGAILVIGACLTVTFKGKLPNPWKLKPPA